MSDCAITLKLLNKEREANERFDLGFRNQL